MSTILTIGEITTQASELNRALASASIQIEELPLPHFNLTAWGELRQAIQTRQPDAIHVCGTSALRLLALCRWKGKRIVSPLLTGEEHRSWLSWVDRILLRRADHVLCWNHTEVVQCRALKVDESKSQRVMPGRSDLRQASTISIPAFPDDARVILCAGPLEKRFGFQEAIWAFHLLRLPLKTLRLVIVGKGSDEANLRGYADDLGVRDVVHFVGEQVDLKPWLARAEQVWSPSRREVGSQLVIDAMIAGRPVLANAWPHAQELIRDGETGCLTIPGDVANLCRRAYPLLKDETKASEMGRRARAVALEHFNLEQAKVAIQRMLNPSSLQDSESTVRLPLAG